MSTLLDTATELQTKAGKPAFVKFDRIAKHLPGLSEREGRYMAVDVDIVTVRQPGAMDSVIFEVDKWLKQNAVEVSTGRLPLDHADFYKRSAERWRLGQAMPIEGTPIKGWAVISPAQADMLIYVGIRTVEELATTNAEGRQRIGMGATTLQNKAMAWLAQAQDKGPLTLEMAALKDKNTLLEANLLTMQNQIDELKAAKPAPVTMQQQSSPDTITAEELLEEDPPKRGPGRPRKEG